MKKIVLLICAVILSTVFLKAQKTIVVKGQIDRKVANQKVWISFFSNPSTCTVLDTTVTDTAGKYSYSFTVGTGCAYNGVRVNMLGCRSIYDTLWNTQYYDSLKTGPDTLTANFKYCDTCKVKASFIDSVNGKAVKFSPNPSLGNPNKFKWYFGDPANTTSTLREPTFTYDSLFKGYMVCLVATDTITGCKDSACRAIYTVSNCSGFFASFTDSIYGDTVFFFNNSSSSATNYNWFFGDGQTSNVSNPVYEYAAFGSYNVCLEVTDSSTGCKQAFCKLITVGTNPCIGFTAGFTHSISDTVVTFTSSGSTSSSATNFEWFFGDGGMSTLQNPTHNYGKGGTYTACLIARDTTNGCIDTTCKIITITTNPCAGFHAGYADSVSGQTVRYKSSGLTSGTANKFFWNFGDGSSATTPDPIHVYSAVGTYTVCFFARDTINGCIDSVCKSISTTNCVGFAANFTTTVNCNTAQITNTTSSGANKFSWSSNNGQTSSVQNPTFTYNTSGSFNICLTAQDTINNCVSTICKSVLIENSLQGTIYRNNNQLADSGWVWLIDLSVDSTSGDTILTAIDSALFTSPNADYKFTNVPVGHYLLKAALLPGAAFYSNRMPTYYVQETRWDKATFIKVNSPCAVANIVLKAGTNPGGAGFVGGLVSQGANKIGDPLNQVLVLLYNSDGSPFGFTYTDINGEYEFANIAYGDYKVVVDVLGKRSDEYTVTVDANSPTNYNGNFDVNTKDVTLTKSGTNGIAKIAKGKLSVYPNPTSANATAVFEAASSSTATVTIMDMAGKVLNTATITTDEGMNTVALNTATLNSGLYLITINTGNTLYTARLGINR